MSLEALSRALWNQREHAELVLFKTDEARLLCEAGEHRWLPYASQEIEAVVQDTRTDELARAMATAPVLAQLKLNENNTLADIANTCTEPWQTIFEQHLTALRAIFVEVDQKSTALRTALTKNESYINEADPLDKAILEITYNTIVDAVNHMVQPTLRDFLR